MIFMFIFVLYWQTPLAESAEEWKHLLVTFRVFDSMPHKETDAITLGWSLLDDGCNKDNSKFPGKRYVLDGVHATVLIYDYTGAIAGMQMGKKSDPVYLARKFKYGDAIVSHDGYMYVTAYFVDPANICNRLLERRTDITGDRLVFSLGAKGYMTTPMIEKDIQGTKWVEGKCFPGMGRHYWYDIQKDMDCDDLFPAFLMYDKGRLTGFGFSTNWEMKSKRIEHPPAWIIHYFFKKETQPTCLARQDYRSIQHVFFNNASLSYPLCV